MLDPRVGSAVGPDRTTRAFALKPKRCN